MSSFGQSAATVAVASVVTVLLRFLPFLIFPENKELPKPLVYFSNVLPAAIMGMLLVYCFRNTNILAAPHGIPELIAAVVTAVLYLWRRSFLLSIAVGTILYMILVQLVFVI